VKRFVFIFISVFIVECFLFSVIYYSFQHWLSFKLFETTKDLADCVSFSFNVQTQTVEFDGIYGFGRLFTILQSLFDKIFWGIGLGYFIFKLLVPSESTIVFSKSAFYLKTEQKYCFLLVNTSNTKLEHLTFICTEKFFRRHKNSDHQLLPYLRNTVLAIKMCKSDILQRDPKDFDPNEDGMKLSVTCSLPFAQFSIAHKYDYFNIYIIEDTDFMDQPMMQNPNLSSNEFWKYFHKPLPNNHRIGPYFQNKRNRSTIIT